MAPRIVILTGAGVSADSGIPTFRDENGLWRSHRIEDVASPTAYRLTPELVHQFYDQRRRGALEAEPNDAHIALAALERALGDELLIVTQNVDDLHERAGSKNVIHIHGRLDSALCTSCDRRHPWHRDLGDGPPCPACGERTLRPDIVWFGENVRRMPEIHAAVDACELLVVIGTSGNVHPAAGLTARAQDHGATTVLLNREQTPGDFDVVELGPASDVVPAWVERHLRGGRHASAAEPDPELVQTRAADRHTELGRVENVFIDVRALIDDSGVGPWWQWSGLKTPPALTGNAPHFFAHPASRLDQVYRLFVTVTDTTALDSDALKQWYWDNFGSDEGFLRVPLVVTMDKRLEVDDWVVTRLDVRDPFRSKSPRVIELGSNRYPDWPAVLRFLLLRPDIHGE